METLFQAGRWILGLLDFLRPRGEGSVTVRVPVAQERRVSVSIEVGARPDEQKSSPTSSSQKLLRAVQNGGEGRPNLVALGW